MANLKFFFYILFYTADPDLRQDPASVVCPNGPYKTSQFTCLKFTGLEHIWPKL